MSPKCFTFKPTFILVAMSCNFPVLLHGQVSSDRCLYADVNHFFFVPLAHCSHRREVILAPWSIDVGYFYDIIFSHALIPIKFSHLQWAGGYPRIKAQGRCIGRVWMRADVSFLKSFATIHHFWNFQQWCSCIQQHSLQNDSQMLWKH